MEYKIKAQKHTNCTIYYDDGTTDFNPESMVFYEDVVKELIDDILKSQFKNEDDNGLVESDKCSTDYNSGFYDAINLIKNNLGL